MVWGDEGSWRAVPAGTRASGSCAGKEPDDQENYIRIAKRPHVRQSSWVNTAAERKIPSISSLRPNLPGICRAAELHLLEVLHGEFMVVPESVF